jgi:hypothetical protein
MTGIARALTTLAGAAAAGFLIWFTPHFDRAEASGYWGALGVLAAAGLLFGLGTLPGGGNPPKMFAIAFLPVLFVCAWVAIAMEPYGNWSRDHIRAWDKDLGITHGVHNLGERPGLLAFAVGVLFALTVDPANLRPRRKAVVPTTPAPVVGREAADEPPGPPGSTPDVS